MALVCTGESISITKSDRLGVSRLIREAEAGHERVVLRNSKPVAAVVSMKRLEQLERLQDDLLDISIAATRMLTTGSDRHGLDVALAHFGFTREQLRDLPE